MNLDEMRRLYAADRAAEAKERAAREQACIEADRQHFEALVQQHLSPEVLADFELVYDLSKAQVGWTMKGEPYVNNQRWLLVPKALPDDVRGLALVCTRHDGRPEGLTLQTNVSELGAGLHQGYTLWTREGDPPSLERQRQVLAALLVPAADAIQRTRAERRAKEEQYAREEADREVRNQHRAFWLGMARDLAEQLADEAVAKVARGAEDRVSALVAPFTWPEGRKLTVYLVEWTAGYDSEGGAQVERFYTLDEPRPDAFFQAMNSRGLHDLKIQSPNGFKVTRESWRSARDARGAEGLVFALDVVAWSVDACVRCPDDSYLDTAHVQRHAPEATYYLPRGGLALALGLHEPHWEVRRAIGESDRVEVTREVPLRGFEEQARAS